MTMCSVEGCARDEPTPRRGMCRPHYIKFRRYGDALAPNRKPGPARQFCTVEGCETRVHGDGLCAKHYWRRNRHGDPTWRLPTAQERYSARVAPPNGNGCRLWMGEPGDDGYGKIDVDGRTVRSHRYGWELANGPIPPGLLVCHTCDVPLCHEPTHWFLGTVKDNAQDAVAKGRLTGNQGPRDSRGRFC